MPVFDPSVLGDHLREQTSRSRFGTALMGLFGILSLLLAAVGIYGVLTCQIDERRQEIGIRMALGAARRRVVREVVVEGMAMVGVGLVAGWALAALTAGLLAGVLYGVQPRDPATLLTTGGALALVALAACALPAFRASRVDPLVALRHD
ncbi:MAG: FtsX-like permease family protein [Acidobacteriota bacterium]